MAEEIHVGDEGTEMIARVRDRGAIVDLTDFDTYVYRFRPPGGITVEEAAEFLTNGEDGMLVFVTPPDFFDTAGQWVWQVVLTSAEGVWHSNRVRFTVYENI